MVSLKSFLDAPRIFWGKVSGVGKGREEEHKGGMKKMARKATKKKD